MPRVFDCFIYLYLEVWQDGHIWVHIAFAVVDMDAVFAIFGDMVSLNTNSTQVEMTTTPLNIGIT